MRVLHISLSMLVVFCAKAQSLQPEFSFTIYAEDARGNKDSVIIGYHPDARQDEVLDTRFADKDISDRPFDSVFEIRVHKVFKLWNKGVQNAAFINKGMSKHLTLKHDSNKCVESQFFQHGPGITGYILVKMKYSPLKLYWDKSKFSKSNNPCVSRSFVFYSEKLFDLGFPRSQFNYLEEKSSVLDTVLEPLIFKNNSGMLDTMQANYMITFQKSGVVVSTSDVPTGIAIKVYPNPCIDKLYISLLENIGEISLINIFTQDGSMIDLPFTQSNDKVVIQTENLLQGQYYITMKTSDGRILSTKFYKAY